ncbi:MAG: hypothetical protein IJA69_00810, partial [Clostridia bacterium]|nr:hypothetical protein [Clostridia bacterium]
ANGIVADVEFVSLTGHDATNSTLNTFEKVTLDNNTPGSAVQAKMATWQNLDIEFAETGADVVLTFKITNKMDDKLSVNISSNYASNVNSNAKIEISEQVSAIAANDATPKQYTVTFKIGNTELDAALEDFDINIELIKGEATVATINEVKVGDTAITSYAGQELKANALSLTDFAGTQNVSIPASGQVAIKTNLTAKTPNFAKVNLGYTIPDGKTLQIRSTSLFLDDSKTNQNFYIYLNNTSTTAAITDLSLADLDLTVSLDNSNSLDELVQHDGEANYYYVEMGTMPNSTNTGSEYIRWRYISEDGITKDATPFTTKGTYILESYNATLMPTRAFQANLDDSYTYVKDTTIYANDYALSQIRAYVKGDMLTDFCIDADEDVVYNKISARSLKDLYSSIGRNGESYVGKEKYTDVTNSEEADKLWLPSFQEIKNLLAESDSYAPYVGEDAGADWSTATGASDYYWLRSPNADDSYGAYWVAVDGTCRDDGVDSRYWAARAAFNLD